MPTRDDIGNVAISAHVAHGKTTLVDGMPLQSGSWRASLLGRDSRRAGTLDTSDRRPTQHTRCHGRPRPSHVP